MIRINQISLEVGQEQTALAGKIVKILKLSKKDTFDWEIWKQSVDARHKPHISYIYSVNVTNLLVAGKKVKEEVLVKKLKNRDVSVVEEHRYRFPMTLQKDTVLQEWERPVIVGFGPAGMFAALKLAEAGFRPVVYERGRCVEQRQKDVEDFFAGGRLCTESNVQFGEGGAGTFSDGKLNTVIKDKTGRIREVLRVFVQFGADEKILYSNKPHIGTDVLAKVVKNVREHVIALGGEIHFQTRFEGVVTEDGQVTAIRLYDLEKKQVLERACRQVCLAIGHSARDTFQQLYEQRFVMEPKPFAVGVRVEHPQSLINENAYGFAEIPKGLPVPDYKVTYTTQAGRGVYSFCMCPGGYVVNASSEEGHIAVNGMSYSGRNGENANSAIIVTITPDDFGGGILGGMAFQRKLEKAAYEAGKGNIPVQLFGDFKEKRVSTGLGIVRPNIKGNYTFADLNTVLPEFLASSLKEGISGFTRQVKGYDMDDAVLSGVESRTSSPLRIVRDETLMAVGQKGIYPCGEGAGYAGGITSAAVDGMKVAESMAAMIEIA